MKTTSSRKPKPGPASRDDVLSRIDRRTRAGRIMRSVEIKLTADLGGDPSMAQVLLIQAVAVKAARLRLLADHLFEGGEIASDQHGVLAWVNSMRNDLKVLGIERKAKSIMGTANRLVDHFAQPLAAKKAEAGE